MDIKWYETPEALLSENKGHPDLPVTLGYEGPFSFVPGEHSLIRGSRSDKLLANVRQYFVTESHDKYCVVVACVMFNGMPKWTIYCGDDQVDGASVSDGVALATTLETQAYAPTVIQRLKAQEWVNLDSGLQRCSFLNRLKRTGAYCTHTQSVLQTLVPEQLTAMADELKMWHAGGAAPEPEKLDPSDDFEEVKAFYEAAFIQHVMLAGDRGSGKTTLARKAAKRLGAAYVEMQMHPSMEAWEFRAHDRSWNGKIFTVLGKLAEAVHLIQQGQRVILVLDEFLNMNPVYQTVINSALTLTENDTYLIETGRIDDKGDGIGTTEIVEVPSDMLWVVATTNIGARYNLDKIVPSVRARFLILLMNTNPDRTKVILQKSLTQYGMPTSIAAMFQKFMTACNSSVAARQLDEEATTRLACNVIRMVGKRVARDKLFIKDKKQWIDLIKAQLLREATQVVNFERGELDSSQLKEYTALLEGSFK